MRPIQQNIMKSQHWYNF